MEACLDDVKYLVVAVIVLCLAVIPVIARQAEQPTVETYLILKTSPNNKRSFATEMKPLLMRSWDECLTVKQKMVSFDGGYECIIKSI